MKDSKCRRCGAPVSAVEMEMLTILIAAELDEMITEGAKESGLTKNEVAEKLIGPLLRDTTVCIQCFEHVNKSVPIKEFMNSEFVTGDPAFTWSRIRLAVLDA